MGTEIELKLATSKNGLHRAMMLSWLKKQASESGRKQALTSVYFDTDDFALREHGVSLRVRKVDGHRLQTINANSSALITRDEWETAIDRDQPNLEFARDTALAPLLTAELTERLSPVFETQVERVVIPLHFGNSDIELDSNPAFEAVDRKHGRSGYDFTRTVKRACKTGPLSSRTSTAKRPP